MPSMAGQRTFGFMAFSKLRLSKPILDSLAKQGYTVPTPIQAQAIPVILEGKDVLGCAQTGTGKTAAFALPILERLLAAPVDKSHRGPKPTRVLVLAPTRELATQIGESFETYGSETGFTYVCIFGGVSQFHQVRALHRGVDIIVATPGRLQDLMEQGHVDLRHIQVLILDEADRMLDMGFIQPIREIASETPSTRQTLLFSATMPPEVAKLAGSLLKSPVKIAVTPVASAAPKIEQMLYFIPKGDKQSLLTHFLKQKGSERVVVFTKTKHGADRVGKKLIRCGITAEMIHGNKAQNARTRALDKFRSGRAQVLVATDVAARGLDVDGITHVINFDLPMDPEAYVHRIGRTGRAGATGIAISFCSPDERGLLRDIERLMKTRIDQRPLPLFEKLAREVEQHDDGDREERGERRHFGSSPRPRFPNRAGSGSSSGGGSGGGRGGHSAHFGGEGRPARPERAASDGGSAGGASHGHGGAKPSGGHGTGHGGSHAGGAHKPASRSFRGPNRGPGRGSSSGQRS